MRLHKLGYSNFGPFKGDQAIELPDQNGIAVVYGDNDLGKTTIFNSVRWLFTGNFPERTDQHREVRGLVNSEAIVEAGGEPVTAKVAATVTWKGDKYRLTRTATLEGDKLKRRLDVIRGSDALNAEEAQATLEQMMPERIQQFFLFDAEALNQYEGLLHDSTTGEELKEAIERILGVPVLTNAIQDLGSLIKKHSKVISKLETQDRNAEAAAEALTQLNGIVAKQDEDIAAIESLINKLKTERQAIEGKMTASKKARGLIDTCQRITRDLDKARDELETARDSFKEVAPQAWTAVLTPTLQKNLDKLRAKREQIELNQRDFDREQMLIQLRTELKETGECPCCGQPSGHSKVETVRSVQDQSAALASVRAQIEALEPILNTVAIVRLDERNRALSDAEMKVNDLASDLVEAEADLEEADMGQPDGADLADLPRQLRNTMTQVSNRRKDLREVIGERDENSKQVSKLEDVVTKEGGEAGEAAMKKQRLLTSLRSLFSSAVDNYREALKQRVEQEATAVFLSIRSDPDYAGLSINDDYGLSIVNKDGEIELQRSAGYEHIVALSLIAALQRCAPVQAPIFMDMPFARLDPGHTLRTLKALPTIADQVILFVLESEIDHTEAQNSLKSDLLWARKLVRRSSHHTEILDMRST